MANEFIARNGIISKSNLIVSGSLTALSSIVAQTLVVQTITSSISSITGSTNFGSLAANTHTFTGSLLTSGSIGIGTTPLTILDVKQTATGTTTVNSAFRDSSTNGNALQIWNGNNEARLRAIYYGTPSDQSITFYTITSAGSEAERMRITHDGKVGIGTPTPSAPLEISYNNTSYTTTPILSLNNTNINGQTHINFLITGSLVGKIRSDYEGGMIYVTNNRGADRSHYFLVNGDVGTGSVAMAISASGRIGMGTSSPSARLDIQGGSDGDGMISMGSNSVSGILNSPANIYINADSDNNAASGVIALGFNRTGYTGGTEAVRILENGNVGIGLTTPQSRLDVLTELRVSYANTSEYRVRLYNTDGNGRIFVDGNESALIFGTSPVGVGATATEKARVTSDGYLRLASRGIQFNGDTADVNSLDDYEEGTFTPIITGGSGSPTYSAQAGWYTKVGRVVNIAWFISFSKNTLAGTLRLTNLPFALLNGPGNYYPQGTVLLDSLGTATNNITLQGANNSSGADFIGGNGSTSTHTGLPVSSLGAGSMECRGTLTYFTS